jgi:HEPN domain-containing protein
MPGPDASHWLHRLTSTEWLAAARNDLARARVALAGKDQRGGVTQARRAAGMAWNAWMAKAAHASEDRYGRSYMDHLKALSHDEDVPETVRAAAAALCDAKLNADLVQIGPGSTVLADRASEIIDFVLTVVAPSG